MNLPAAHMTRGYLILLMFAGGLMPATAQQASASLCVYQGEEYSEGAVICVQKSLMLSCSLDGARTVWKVVEKDLGNRCTAANQSAEPWKRFVRRNRPVHQPAAVAEPTAAKCFAFNGKRYCE